MRKFYLNFLGTLLILTNCFTGCKKDDGTPPGAAGGNPLKARLELVSGNNQSGTYGESLANDITLKITAPEGQKPNNYTLQFRFLQGNGQAGAGNILIPDADGLVKVNWKMGCNSPSQMLRAYLVPISAVGTSQKNIDDSVDVKASAIKPSGWGKACGCGTPEQFNATITTYDNKTLYLASDQLYFSTDGGANWAKVAGVPAWSAVVSAQFNSKGWLYVLTRYDGIFLTKDLQNWQPINNGILDKRDPTGFLVTDDLLMVSFYLDGPYMTTDDGGFWQKLLVSHNSQRFYFMKRHPNGNLYLFDDWGTFFMSKDIGKTWQIQQLNYNYFMSQVYGFNIGPDGNLYIGSDDATFAKLSASTLQGTSKRYYQYNSSSQSVTNIQFYNNDVYYLVRSTPKPGVYSINNNWDLVNLGFSKTITSFYIKADGSFLLFGGDGLYYKVQ